VFHVKQGGLFDALHILQNLFQRHHIAILRVNIEQVGFVGNGSAISDTFARDDDSETVLHAINGAGADTPACRASDENDGIHPKRRECGSDRRSEERAGILLGDYQLPFARCKFINNLRA